ncbi:VWA domain-containing protein [Roseospira navarrensis]|uniref:VWA domain-containing protein n=2 Tax=Roseospira navarrensis TaxID=140058 RepID=A0A7X2D3Q0_9PROT|nr:VWA domain-containing protein [Roseospira navarrensis]MQX37058.1 VWA domain-containing protein [Roseospira navarrensis]
MPPPGEAQTAASGGRLADNVMHFVRVLRSAGLRVGPGDTLAALRAVEAVGPGHREDLKAALAAVLVKRRQDRALFDEAFHIFWADPDILGRMMGLLLPRLRTPGEADDGSRRLHDALGSGTPPPPPDRETPTEEQRLSIDLDWSDQERLGAMDFEKMTAEEFRRAQRALERLRLPDLRLKTRRRRPDPHGRHVDLRASMRASLRTGGDALPLRRAAPEPRPPTVVALCDISGSMDRYARIFLRLMHGLAQREPHFHAFVFGTRLTNVTRALRNRDPDVAMAAAAAAMPDWAGGTRIGDCLTAFNRHWSRRVLGQGALVLLMTDGLDQAEAEGLARPMERLHKSCRRLIWLNPLLRWDGFQPKAAGVRAILPHVDDFRPVHSLDSLDQLVAALSAHAAGQSPRRLEAARVWREALAG